MKTFFTALIIVLISYSNLKSQATFQSRGTGSWSSPSTWTLTSGSSVTGWPSRNTDHVVIRAGHSVTLPTTGTPWCASLDVNGGGILFGAGRTLTMYGNLTQSGAIVGSLGLEFVVTATLSAIGTPYNAKGSIKVFNGATLTISSNTSINMQGFVELLNNNSKVINQGNVTLTSAGVIVGTVRLTGTNTRWINDGASSLTVNAIGTANASALFDFTGTGSTVNFNNAATFIYPGSYYNLNINSSNTKTLTSDIVVANNLVMGGLTSNIINLNGRNLSIGGNLTCNGINGLTAGSTLIFNGSAGATQNVTGVISFSVQSLEINTPSGGGVFLNTTNVFNNKVYNTLTMTDGSFDPNGKLTLVSDASNTARIAPIASGSITSNIVMEKYFPTFTARYFELSSPSQGSVVMDWDNEIYISGIGPYDNIGGPAGVDGDAVIPGSGLAAQSMYTYDEPSSMYVAVTGSNTPLVPATGYNLWFEDEVNNQWSAKTINTVGVPNQGDIILNLTNSPGAFPYDGYHLIGNPYASAIDLSLIYDFTFTDPAKIDYFYCEVLDASGNFLPIDPTTSGAIIYPHQGFWIRTKTPGAPFTFHELCKVSDVNTAFNKTKPASYDIKLMLTSASTSYYHENTIHFNDKSTVNFERPYDMAYRSSPIKSAPALYMLDASNIKMAKNTINTEANDVTFPLGIYTPQTAVYYLDASVLNVDQYQYVWIEHVKTGKQFDLNSSAIAIEGEEGQTNTDYVLRLSKTKQSSTISQTMLESDLVIFNTDGTINLKSNLSSHLLKDVTMYDMTGKLILEQLNVNVELGSITKIDISNFADGVYVVNVVDEKGNSMTKKIVK